jgi:hypothetical protein
MFAEAAVMASLAFFIPSPAPPIDGFLAFDTVFRWVGGAAPGADPGPSLAAIVATVAATMLLLPLICLILRRAA